MTFILDVLNFAYVVPNAMGRHDEPYHNHRPDSLPDMHAMARELDAALRVALLHHRFDDEETRVTYLELVREQVGHRKAKWLQDGALYLGMTPSGPREHAPDRLRVPAPAALGRVP